VRVARHGRRFEHVADEIVHIRGVDARIYHFGGYGFYPLKGKPAFLWNLLDLERLRWEGPALSPGKHTLEFDFTYDGLGFATLAFNNLSGIGRGGTGVLKVDG
jgi:arylsulfatase